MRLGPQVRERRFGALVRVDPSRLQAVEASSVFDICQRLLQAILAMKPAMRPEQRRQIIFIAAQDRPHTLIL